MALHLVRTPLHATFAALLLLRRLEFRLRATVVPNTSTSPIPPFAPHQSSLALRELVYST
jgi:hypothetical protein